LTDIAFLFPGQGSQAIGMGAEYVAADAGAAKLFAQASGALGYDLQQLCAEGPAERLNLTVHTQPAIFTVSSAVVGILQEKGVKPAYVAGHSVGEFAAMCAAGMLDFASALGVLKRRAELMHQAGQERGGAMSAVINFPAEKVAQVCASVSGVVGVANDNSPKQVVISGDAEAVAAAGVALKEAGARRVIPLPVSGAFHSPLMEQARAPFTQALEALTWKAPECTFIANADAAPHSDASEFPDLIGGQLMRGVQWTRTIQFLLDKGVTRFIEVGPGKVLAGLMRGFEGDFKVASTDTPAALELAVEMACSKE
jgi:[acyl-carrier-protein] S-malonyltransferase